MSKFLVMISGQVEVKAKNADAALGKAMSKDFNDDDIFAWRYDVERLTPHD